MAFPPKGCDCCLPFLFHEVVHGSTDSSVHTFLKREGLHVFYFPFVSADSKNLLSESDYSMFQVVGDLKKQCIFSSLTLALGKEGHAGARHPD